MEKQTVVIKPLNLLDKETGIKLSSDISDVLKKYGYPSFVCLCGVDINGSVNNIILDLGGILGLFTHSIFNGVDFNK